MAEATNIQAIISAIPRGWQAVTWKYQLGAFRKYHH
jgi:hypothetical protein